MSRSRQTVNVQIRGEFSVYDSSNAVVTGLVNTDFTRLLSYNGTNDTTTLTVTEVTSGRYTYTFTPASVGFWAVVIRHATYNPRGWEEDFDVTAT